MNKQNDHDSYIIPPNFIDSGSFFGGMFKARNAIEALVIFVLITVPVFNIGVSLTAKIIILCLTALPLALFALIGISGESLSSFAFIFLRYLRNKRVVGVQNEENLIKEKVIKEKQNSKFSKMKLQKNPSKTRKEDFPAEFDEVKGYARKQKMQAKIPAKKSKQQKERIVKDKKVNIPNCLNPVAEYIPIEKIEHGVIYTKDNRFVKIIEVEPINFLLRSAREQRSIIYSFISYLKISPVKLQFKVLTKRADINRHLDAVKSELLQETDEGCRLLQEDYLTLVHQIGSKEAITRRFFIIFEYEPWSNAKRGNEEQEALLALQTATHTAENYLRQSGNGVMLPDDETEFTIDILYNFTLSN